MIIIYGDQVGCPYMVIRYAHGIPSSNMIIVCDHHLGWSYMMIKHDERGRWSNMKIITIIWDGPLLSSYVSHMTITYTDHIWCHHDDRWWLYLMANVIMTYDHHAWSPYTTLIYDHHTWSMYIIMNDGPEHVFVLCSCLCSDMGCGCVHVCGSLNKCCVLIPVWAERMLLH